MRRTVSRLSDGREIIYFDHDASPERVARDLRDLQPGSTAQGTLRRDALTGEWISIAGHRQTRTFLPAATDCPLCPTTPDRRTEIPEADYDVVVFENRFPSFLTGPELGDTENEAGWDSSLPAHGRCEVVAFSADHTGSIAELDDAAMALVVDAWIDRSRWLADQDGIRSVFVFENRGAEVGVTLHHPHGQIYAYPFVPPMARTVLRESATHRARTGRRLLDDIVDRELRDGERIIHRDDDWVAFVPYAARWPFEIQLHPLRDVAALDELDAGERRSLAHFLPRLIRALDGIFELPFPYMSGWLQRPAHPTPSETADSRLFMRLISNRRSSDKLKYLAGSESLMGAFINDVSPEDSAAQVRAALMAVGE